MKAKEEAATFTMSAFNKPTFRQYEIVNVRGGRRKTYNMVREDAKVVNGSCTVSLRRLNTHKWNWIAKIQIKIFKLLIQEPQL